MSRKPSNKIFASKEKPVLLCTTCGCATDNVISRASVQLTPKIVPQKRWQRCIKKTEDRGKVVYMTYMPFYVECMKKKHKFSVRKASFPRFIKIKSKKLEVNFMTWNR